MKENLSYFGNAFIEFKNRVDAGEDALSVADDVLYPLGEGSTRVVFGFPDNQDIVLKVINTKKFITPTILWVIDNRDEMCHLYICK